MAAAVAAAVVVVVVAIAVAVAAADADAAVVVVVGRRNCIKLLNYRPARNAFIPGFGPRKVRPSDQPKPGKALSPLEVVIGSTHFGTTTRDQISNRGIN